MERFPGYTTLRTEPCPEQHGTLTVLTHDVSGATVLLVENEDINKAFGIGFGTFPSDDTGVFHILEHSVLAGSEKYPVTSPFLQLLKSSMASFLNAMTFPDKTVYPFATPNETDFKNLMDVYLNAVFCPLATVDKAVFEQEGWHRSADGTVSGVVYNEMQGALAAPDAQLENTLERAMFPDTAYGFLTRGCPNRCGFCVVSGKEGAESVHVADLSEFWDGQKEIKLMDANLLACPDHERLIGQLAESRALVDFSQGLDIRLITPDNAALLNRVRTKTIHFAWDNPNVDLTGCFQRFSELSKIRDFRRKRVYVLTNYNSTHEQDLYRVDTLRRMGYDPYVMVYERPTAPPVTRHLQRWVNNKRIFRTVERFADYEPVKKLGGDR